MADTGFDLGTVKPELIEGARLVLGGMKVLPASLEAGCSRDTLSRLLKKPGAVEAIKAHKAGAKDAERSRAQVRERQDVANDTRAALGADRRERVYRACLEGVPRDLICSELGIAPSTYWELLREARAEASKAFREVAGDLVGEVAEQYEEIFRQAMGAAMLAMSPPPLPDGLVPEGADLPMPDPKAAAACWAVAIKAIDARATLAGVKVPKAEVPTAGTAARLGAAVAALAARNAARQPAASA